MGAESFARCDRTDQGPPFLEHLILTDPFREQLAVLLDDFPRKVTLPGPSSALDGCVFRTPTNDAYYYVSRGMRHRIRHASWILSRPDGMDCVEDIASSKLEALPEGLSLE